MKIREETTVMRGDSRFDADYTAESIRELEEQYAAGEIEAHAYQIKKHALVKLYLKATTSPKRQRRDDFE